MINESFLCFQISSGCKLCTRFVRSGRTPQVLLSSSAAATTEKLTMEKSEQRRKRRKILDQILRVDHAGELGANYIYKGQLKALGSSSPAAKTIEVSVVRNIWLVHQTYESWFKRSEICVLLVMSSSLI